MHILIWAIVCVVCLIIEAITVGDLISVWFAFGALITCIISAFGVTTTTAEIIVFVCVSSVSMLALRPICMRALKNSNNKTNLDTIKNSTVKLISPVTEDSMGTAKIDGVVWSVVSKDGSQIPADTYCEVVSIEGNKLVVKTKK